MKKRDENKEARKFGVILGIAALLFAGWFHYRDATLARGIAGAIAVPFLTLPFAARGLWLKFFRLWMKLAEAISWVMTRVILTTFYYLILTPTALVMRALGKRPLDLVFKDGRASYWKPKPEAEYTLERYKKLY